MTADITESASSLPERHLLRSWRSVMFAPAGDGRRRRRGSDGARLAAALLTLVCCLLVIRYDSRVDRAITQVIHPPPRSITWLVTVVYQAGSFGIAVTLAGLALLARRWEIARDIGLSAAGTAAGVAESDATAAVFIQRLFTSYLPPIWGWITLVWMRKREYL